MTHEELLAKMPGIVRWIDDTLAAHAAEVRSVASFGFKRLPDFFSADLLQRARVVITARVPDPPLRSLGLSEFAGSLPISKGGITFKDTYFLQASEERNEAIHFHELVHVIQWGHLGVEKFLLAYAMGLAKYGYKDSQLEKMAYLLQAYFEGNGAPMDVEKHVRNKLDGF